jgi:hypothetical protein
MAAACVDAPDQWDRLRAARASNLRSHPASFDSLAQHDREIVRVGESPLRAGREATAITLAIR